MTHGRVAAVALVVCAVVLSGCGQPQPATTTPPSEQPETRVSSVAPVAPRPPEARETAEGAADATRYWFAALSYAVESGEVAPLEEVSHPGCAECQAAVDAVRGSYGDGGTLRGGAYTVRDAWADPPVVDGRALVNVTVDREPRSSFGPLGDRRGSLPGAAFIPCVVAAVWSGSAWRVRSVQSAVQII